MRLIHKTIFLAIHRLSAENVEIYLDKDVFFGNAPTYKRNFEGDLDSEFRELLNKTVAREDVSWKIVFELPEFKYLTVAFIHNKTSYSVALKDDLNCLVEKFKFVYVNNNVNFTRFTTNHFDFKRDGVSSMYANDVLRNWFTKHIMPVMSKNQLKLF